MVGKFKLGKKPKRVDPRTLQLKKYLKPEALPAPPASVDWSEKMGPLGAMLNDTLGDCTCAAVGHCIQEWTSDTEAAPVILPDSTILSFYEAVSGYNPTTGANDDGAVVLDVLNYWRQNGVGGDTLNAYAEVEVDQQMVETATDIFGNTYLGLQMPLSAQGQTTWTVPPGGATGNGAPGSWGGHAVPVVAYDANGVTVISWGARYQATWAFVTTYCDEAYALIDTDWLAQGEAPSGVDLAQLQSDLSAVTESPAESWWAAIVRFIKWLFSWV